MFRYQSQIQWFDESNFLKILNLDNYYKKLLLAKMSGKNGCFHKNGCMFQYHNVLKLNISDNDIIWPGSMHQKPEGLIIPTFLKVMTIDEQPFVYTRRVQDESECSSLLEEEPCPWFNNTGSGIKKQWSNLMKLELFLFLLIYFDHPVNILLIERLVKYFSQLIQCNYQFCVHATWAI